MPSVPLEKPDDCVAAPIDCFRTTSAGVRVTVSMYSSPKDTLVSRPSYIGPSKKNVPENDPEP